MLQSFLEGGTKYPWKEIAPLSAVLGFSQETNALMIALYIVMDSFGTATNVTGDGAIAVILDKIYKNDHNLTEDETEA